MAAAVCSVPAVYRCNTAGCSTEAAAAVRHSCWQQHARKNVCVNVALQYSALYVVADVADLLQLHIWQYRPVGI
jgi:hypothetical protein